MRLPSGQPYHPGTITHLEVACGCRQSAHAHPKLRLLRFHDSSGVDSTLNPSWGVSREVGEARVNGIVVALVCLQVVTFVVDLAGEPTFIRRLQGCCYTASQSGARQQRAKTTARKHELSSAQGVWLRLARPHLTHARAPHTIRPSSVVVAQATTEMFGLGSGKEGCSAGKRTNC